MDITTILRTFKDGYLDSEKVEGREQMICEENGDWERDRERDGESETETGESEKEERDRERVSDRGSRGDYLLTFFQNYEKALEAFQEDFALAADVHPDLADYTSVTASMAGDEVRWLHSLGAG